VTDRPIDSFLCAASEQRVHSKASTPTDAAATAKSFATNKTTTLLLERLDTQATDSLRICLFVLICVAALSAHSVFVVQAGNWCGVTQILFY
jgi:hypothetical protein